MSELAQFHLLAHIFISAIGGILLLAIWYNIRRRFRPILEDGANEKRVDKGLLFLSLAMFTWVLAGIWGLIAQQYGFSKLGSDDLGARLFSIVNNLFLLLSLFYFYYAPPFIYNNKKNVKIIIGVIIAISLVTLFLNATYSDINTVSSFKIVNLPDLILSFFLSGLLMISFYKTFVHRGLQVVAFISVVVITMMMISQLQEVFPSIWAGSELVNNLIKIVSKTSFDCYLLGLGYQLGNQIGQHAKTK